MITEGHKGSWGPRNVPFLDLNIGYMAIFSWQKFIKLYTSDLCSFLCINNTSANSIPIIVPCIYTFIHLMNFQASTFSKFKTLTMAVFMSLQKYTQYIIMSIAFMFVKDSSQISFIYFSPRFSIKFEEGTFLLWFSDFMCLLMSVSFLLTSPQFE